MSQPLLIAKSEQEIHLLPALPMVTAYRGRNRDR